MMAPSCLRRQIHDGAVMPTQMAAQSRPVKSMLAPPCLRSQIHDGAVMPGRMPAQPALSNP